MALQYILLAAVLLWAGYLLAISFLESWLKFRAAGVTLPVGLSIGKLVFNVLNKIEWVLAAIVLAGCLMYRHDIKPAVLPWIIIPVIVLIVQTFWLLPALNARANAVISGKTLPPSSLHWFYIPAEAIKLIALFVLGFKLLQLFVAGS